MGRNCEQSTGWGCFCGWKCHCNQACFQCYYAKNTGCGAYTPNTYCPAELTHFRRKYLCLNCKIIVKSKYTTLYSQTQTRFQGTRCYKCGNDLDHTKLLGNTFRIPKSQKYWKQLINNVNLGLIDLYRDFTFCPSTRIHHERQKWNDTRKKKLEVATKSSTINDRYDQKIQNTQIKYQSIHHSIT